MKTLLTLLLLTLAYPSLATAQDSPTGLKWMCVNGRCGWYRVDQPKIAAPVIDPRIEVLSAKIDRLAVAIQQSSAPSESEYQTFAVEPARAPVSLATFAIEPAMEPQARDPLATGEAAHTPMSEVVRVIGLLPKPEIAFVDFGCGYDARWCIAAAERWGCKCVGIEIDSRRASAARERVRNLGLDHLITIVEGDAGTVTISGDVAVVYLYPDMLARLKPRLEGFKAFASYLHQPPGINCTKNGDTWLYRRQAQAAVYQQSGAVWQGMIYNQRVCNDPRCRMCNSIGWQLGIQ